MSQQKDPTEMNGEELKALFDEMSVANAIRYIISSH